VKSATVRRKAQPARRKSDFPDLAVVDPQFTAKAETASHLTATADPTVFLNREGNFVDKRGVLLSLSGNGRAKAESERAMEILGGPVDSPAKLLKLMALDPTVPMMVRLDAAKAAAPYFDKKTPTAIESKSEDLTLDLAAIAALPKAERLQLLSTLKTMGVDLGVS
jgi:DNA-binding MarR family transcriptional regulator